ncbi:Rieske (2Fe-2S) protein [Flavobacterium orientale]|uniref:Rieske domain-containing protein n=1 Tax=Flavobacterium orientale TaxID=1756020 RepID=A0A917D9J8_9FLAO|nr:hypothetical protein [Flavobacterium orientale]GGD18776.1 hypothetical protein GCM10011343_06710 [Flavobacterium orientale]
MRKAILVLIFSFTLLNCDSDGFNNNNPYLPNYSFSFDVNMNLPLYSQLQFVSNGVLITQPGVGVNGIIVFNAGNGVFNAFDAGCPNQPLTSCSTMTINGINAVCPCDNEEYSLFTGLGALQYPLKRYRVEVLGNIIRVYN